MKNLRILQGAYIPALGKVVNYNDEIQLEDAKLAQHLVDQGYADELIPEKNEPKPVKKVKKVEPKDVKVDA